MIIDAILCVHIAHPFFSKIISGIDAGMMHSMKLAKVAN